MPPKMLLDSKVVKIDPSIIISLCQSKSVKHSVELTYAIISVKKIFPPHKNISNARTNLTLKIKAKLLEMSEAFQGGFVVDIY